MKTKLFFSFKSEFFIFLLTFTMIIIFSSNLNGQKIERFLLSSSGDEIISDQIKIEYSLGEVAISYYESPSIKVSQGFHQGNSMVSSIIKPSSSIKDIIVYPNPGFDKLHFENPSASHLQYKIIDINGIEVLQGEFEEVNLTLNTHFMHGGIYIISFSNSENYHQNYKFIKL